MPLQIQEKYPGEIDKNQIFRYVISMKKLSVVIITLNEEDRIEAALQSVAGIADEVIVVDGYSTDNTCAIAEKFGAAIHRHEFLDFGSQKNFALKQAQHDWVLNLDADERVCPLLKEAILHFKQSADDSCAGYAINRKTFYLGRWIKHSGWYPDRKLRLFRKSKSRWSGRVHEALNLEGPTEHMPGDILHYTYRDITDHINRLNRYSHMQAQDMAAKGARLLFLRALLLPPVTFLRFFLWKAGFMDGFPGFIIALVSSWATAMKYLKTIALKKGLPN